ncbi:MAG: ABC transporter ATP-binding protein [Lachnospiraceae bacterium]|nr:ABC transporter ATP-binding protein [Lachnospiraceae bacterium]
MKGLIHFLKLAWKTAPGYMLVMVLSAVFKTVQVLLNVYLPKLLIDELTGSKDVNTIIMYLAFIIANVVGMQLITNTINRYIAVKREKVALYMRRAMSKKIMNISYSYLEDPYYLDLKERAVFAINNQNAIEQMIMAVADVLNSVLTLAGLVAIMATLGPVLIIALAVAMLLVLAFYGIISKTMIWFQSNIVPINRRFGYYFNLSMGKASQKEIRLYNMESMITNTILNVNKNICGNMKAMSMRVGISLGLMNAVTVLMAAFAYVYVGIRTVSDRFGKLLSLGDLTMYVTSAISVATSVGKTGQDVVQMFQIASFLKPYLEFMEIPEEVKEKNKEKFIGEVETIEFRDVTFTYPKAEKPVLRNISFKVNKGQKISVVGLNGAGKSTLVKLICRMFKVDSGEILVNGKNILDYEYNSYMAKISAVFQDYSIFNFSIRENISCVPEGDDVDKINRLIDEVGLKEKVSELPKGIESRFGKEYDEEGIEMSGGQAQKIAIARAIYKKDAGMVILDEPASALDPIAEAEIYEKFNSLVEDKTAFYISHRMSSSRFCDKILIIDGGTVTDFDTHDNLMKKTDSLYYKLFTSQAENYKLA